MGWVAYNTTVTFFLSIWLILSVAAQFKRFSYRKLDRFDLLPTCKFFAPRPISFDYHIYVRCQLHEGMLGDWQPLYLLKKSLWCCLWNPQHRLRKAASDVVKLFRRVSKGNGSVRLSHPYLLILNVASTSFRGPGVIAVQFSLVRSASYELDTHEAIFLSDIHPIM
jgi:hypothetical protein